MLILDRSGRPLGRHPSFHFSPSLSQHDGRRAGARLFISLAFAAGLGAGCGRAVAPASAELGAPCLSPNPPPPIGGGWSPEGSRFDLCGNGVDDDANGTIDDDCDCVPGEIGRCFFGAPRLAGVGLCGWGEHVCEASGTASRWGECTGAGLPITETCDDGLDQDCDGAIDESCPCDIGAVQPCYAGTAAERDVASCTSGEQRCEEGDGLDGVPIGVWSACTGAGHPEAEACNTSDDDCDGAIDERVEVCNFADDDCDEMVDEGACVTVAGAALTRFWPGIVASGAFLDGASIPLHTIVPVSAPACPDGEVLYETSYGTLECVPAPPTDCPLLTQPLWDDEAGEWTCVPCEVLVQYGVLFQNERVCTGMPELVCPEGEVPTFDAELGHWVCAPLCDNTDYDVVYLAGLQICVPC